MDNLINRLLVDAVLLNLRLSQNRQHVKCGQKTTLFVLLELTADESTQIVQKRKHVSLVMDCSKSMHGKKLDDAKNAAMEVVSKLNPNDLVSIVTFDSNVDVKLNPTPASDKNIRDVLKSISTVKGTALHGGMATAFQLLKQASAPNIISRMGVFSDGKPNVGPRHSEDFVQLASTIRHDDITVDVFGIGGKYNELILGSIAENGGGKWKHVSDSEDLTKVVGKQIEYMQKTLITNPQLQIILMDGAVLNTLTITKPTLQEVDLKSKQLSTNTTSVGLSDIIKDEAQAFVMRITIPPIDGSDMPFLTAVLVKGTDEVAYQTAVISCTTDKDLYNLESDPSPRVILSGSEATLLLRRGLEGDPEATQMANTILKNLDDPETTRLMDTDAQATIVHAQNLAGNIRPGMSESEKKQLLYDTTHICAGGPGDITGMPEPTCLNCGHVIQPDSKTCGMCGFSSKT